MNYFIDEAKRQFLGGTAFFEFQQGPYDGKCWKEDSLYISSDNWNQLRLSSLFRKMNPEFDKYGITEINQEMWKAVCPLDTAPRSPWHEIMDVLIPWAKECFKKNGVFTIVGM